MPIIKKEASREVHDSPEKKRKPIFWFNLLFIAIFIVIIVLMADQDRPFIIWDEQGKPVLAPWRQRKLDKALDDFDHSEQYALLVTKNGWYPCYSCQTADSIHLFVNEVWKYGSTTKGELGRYGNKLPIEGLIYFVQFRGTIEACLKEEKRKIFNYPTLPENLKRSEILIRPPGNNYDS